MTNKLTVWRGISFRDKAEADRAKKDILKNGDKGRNLIVRSTFPHHRKTLGEVVEIINSGRYTANTIPSVCVTTDIESALFYAERESRSFRYIIEAEIDREKLIVDGADFLFNGLACYKGTPFTDEDRAAIIGAYGEKGLEYFLRRKEIKYGLRFDYTYAMIMDSEVVEAHINSTTRIYGRYQTRFFNSFYLSGGIPADSNIQIHDASDIRQDVTNREADKELSISDFREKYW